MDSNPIALIVGTGAAVLIARTFYESINSARRGHSSAVLKKDSNSQRSHKKPSANQSTESNVSPVDKSSSSASGSASSNEFTDTLSLVDQKLGEFANEANAESNVIRPTSSTPSMKLSQEKPNTQLVEHDLVENQEEARRSVVVGSANEAAVDHSLDGLALAQTSGAVREAEEFIQLHACSHLPDDSTKQSQSGVHVSVDIMKQPENGVHVSVEVMPRADGARLSEHVDHISQSVMKQLEGSYHLSERIEHASERGMLHLEGNIHAKHQFEHVHGNAIQTSENSARERPANGYENIGQRSHSRGSEQSALSEHGNDSAMKRPGSGAHVSEHLEHVDHGLENTMKPPESSTSLSDHSAHSTGGYENVSERSTLEEVVVNQPVSEHSARSEHGYENTVNETEFNDRETGHSTVDNAQSDDGNEGHDTLKITSSGIDQEIRRSIAQESLKNASNEHPGLVVGEIRLRPETPASFFDPEHIRLAVETLCAIYNDQQKYNKEAKNYLLQIKTAKGDNGAEGNESTANITSGAPFDEVFFSSLPRDNAEEDNTAQIIDTMNEFLVGEDQDGDTESNSAGSDSNVDSNVSEHTVEDDAEEVHEPRVHDEMHAEAESNTTTSSLTNSLVIYVKDRNENGDSRTEGFEDLDVVSFVPDIFQNVIVRRILRE